MSEVQKLPPEHMTASELVDESRRILVLIRDECEPLMADVKRRYEAGELVTRADISIFNRCIALARYAGDCAHRAVHMSSTPRPTKRKNRGLFWFGAAGEGREGSPR